MDALEFLNKICPEHTRTSCSDDNIQNGFWSRYGYDNKENDASGRCSRCMLIQVLTEDEDVPKDQDLNEYLYL